MKVPKKFAKAFLLTDWHLENHRQWPFASQARE
jgi:hypothetical protein